MALALTINGDLRVNGALLLTGAISPGLPRSSFQQEDLAIYPVPFENLRVWDAYQTTLPGTAATDDLGLVGGTFGTASQTVRSRDLKATTGSAYARVRIPLPVEYVAAQTVRIRLSAGMITTVSDTSAVLDIEAYKVDRDGGISADLCATVAQSINSLTFAEKDFDITATTLTPGDVLDVRVTITVVDGATATAVIGAFGALDLLADVKG